MKTLGKNIFPGTTRLYTSVFLKNGAWILKEVFAERDDSDVCLMHVNVLLQLALARKPR